MYTPLRFEGAREVANREWSLNGRPVPARGLFLQNWASQISKDTTGHTARLAETRAPECPQKLSAFTRRTGREER
jgi:hypothetical protein